MTNQNPLAALAARLQALKAEIAAKAEAVKADYRVRIDMMFGDIDQETTPIANGIREHGDSMLDLIDGAVHAIAKLEKRINEANGRAA